jgi:hypothetical protein
MRLLLVVAAAVAAGVLAASAAASSTVVTPPEVSGNWSGYAVTAPTGTPPLTFGDVTGTWVQPRATCVAGSTSASAFWVGIGGYDPSATSLQQLGTSADCDASGKASYTAWWEIVPAASTPIKLKIQAGDTITAAVLVNGSRVTMSLKNVTRKTRFSKTVTVTQPLDVSSAEWIAEAPSLCSSFGRCQVVPLTNFGTVQFTKSAAIGNGHPGTINDPLWQAVPIQLNSSSNFAFGRRFGFAPVAASFNATPAELSVDGRGFSVAAQPAG